MCKNFVGKRNENKPTALQCESFFDVQDLIHQMNVVT